VSEYCGVLLIRPEDEATQGLKSVPAARRYFDELLPQFSPFISDAALQAVIDKEPSRLPAFRFAGPRLHRGSSTVLVGDAIHSVKPYFGLGVNSAFEDVAVLGEVLDTKPTLARALRSYSTRRAAEARVLVEMSRSFDSSGLRGFVSFIGPLILDGAFGSIPLLQKAFAPNTLAMLQRPTISFVAIRWRKRLDRALQLAIVGAVSGLVARGAALALSSAASFLITTALPLAVARPKLSAAAAVAFSAGVFGLLQMTSTPAVVRLAATGGDVADVLASQTSRSAEQGQGGTRRGY